MKNLLAIVSIIICFTTCKKNSLPDDLIVMEEYALPGDTLFPEGIAFDPNSKVFYTGSVTSGDIIKVNVETGSTNIFAKGALQNRKAATHSY